jgi:Icc-related predicted phosphoesterase
MPRCFFVSDLHGHLDRYQKLFRAIHLEKPAAVFFGGDLLPSYPVSLGLGHPPIKDFIQDYLAPKASDLKTIYGESSPRLFLILGNDDVKGAEAGLFEGMSQGLWEYIHARQVHLGDHPIFGYACVPPTPFMLKDWERYDVSRYVDPGCIAPEDGWYSNRPNDSDIKYTTIQKDLHQLTREEDLSKAIFLFHSPPYQTNLDRTGLAGKVIDHVPVDPHVGSIAIRRLIESRQPLLTLHGHIHESASRTGSWVDRLGDTYCFSAAHGGPELALVRFDVDALDNATRELI